MQVNDLNIAFDGTRDILVISPRKKPSAALAVTMPQWESETVSFSETSAHSAATPQTTPQHAQGRPRPKRTFRHRTRRSGKLILLALRDVVIALALLALLLQFFSPTIVREHSMEDTLRENEVLYIARKAYWFGLPQHGDIVVFQTELTDENGERKSLVKRIIGLPGDRIRIEGGMVFRNGTAVEEPYLKSGTTAGTMDEVTVPTDSYFVLGDNREVSNDSRNNALGCIEKNRLQGRVLFRLFPLDRIRVF
jgi:signal peptidase I